MRGEGDGNEGAVCNDKMAKGPMAKAGLKTHELETAPLCGKTVRKANGQSGLR